MVEKRANARREGEVRTDASPQGGIQIPPAPSQAARLDRYMKQASDSMRGLGAFSREIDGSLSSKTSGGDQPAQPAQPARPPRERNSEMGRIIAERMGDALRRNPRMAVRIASDSDFDDAARGNAVPEKTVREGDFSAVPSLQSLDSADYASYSSDISANWLPSIAGPEITSRMSATPPALCAFSETEDMTPAQLFLELQMIGSLGGYLVGSNAIVIPEDVLAFSEADARHVVLHELLHYASWLGGGKDIRWRDDDGRPCFQGNIPSWSMNEGLTELISQEEVRARGFEPTRIGYPAETITCYYMEQLLGDGGSDLLRTAYLSGDFTEVRRLVDAALGTGAFDTLISKHDAAQALEFLGGRLDEREMDRTGWDASPIVAAARAKIAEGS